MYIKDRMRVRDSSGKEFDIEMDLKVEIQPAKPAKPNLIEPADEGRLSNNNRCAKWGKGIKSVFFFGGGGLELGRSLRKLHFTKTVFWSVLDKIRFFGLIF